MKRCFSRGAIVCLIAVLFSPVVEATPVSIDFTIHGSGEIQDSISVPEEMFDWEDVYANPDTRYYYWTGADPLEYDLGGGNIATIQLSIAVKADPLIELGFSVAAGNNATSFSFSSEVMTIEPLINAVGTAAASVNLSGFSDIMWGSFPECYKALYNGSTVFADLIPTGAGMTWPGDSDFLASVPIAGEVSSMQTKWQFILSGGGSASGSSQFEITGDVIPEPATMILLGLGGLALLRKRKRRRNARSIEQRNIEETTWTGGNDE